MLRAFERIDAFAAAETGRRPVLRDFFKTGDAAHLPADHGATQFSAGRLYPKARERGAFSIRADRARAPAAHTRAAPVLAENHPAASGANLARRGAPAAARVAARRCAVAARLFRSHRDSFAAAFLIAAVVMYCFLLLRCGRH